MTCLPLDEMNGSNVQFLNLNELETTVGNQENMDARGFNSSGGMTAAAEGSFELATKLKEHAKDMSAFKFWYVFQGYTPWQGSVSLK